MRHERDSRTGVRDLADRLVTEYAGALAPGQVLGLVYRAASRLAGVRGLAPPARLEMCEVAARRALTDRIAGTTPRPAA